MIQPTLTQNGIALMVKAFCGAEIQFTKLKIGSGSSRDIDIKTLTDLINPIKNINISRMDRNDNNIILVGAGYDNSEVENDITWNEVGVYATDPDEGEILFAYVNTEDALEIIKSNQSGVSIENNLSVMLLISSDINVSAVITSIQYASKQELLDHIKESNPHKTTKEDIGLEKVENLAISDQQPEFDTGISLTNIKVGDTLKTIVSKVWSAIDLLTNHLKAKNPHKITISTIGAAASSHNHDASDINSGVLGKEFGGTGGVTGRIKRNENYDYTIAPYQNGGRTSVDLEKGVWIIVASVQPIYGTSFEGNVYMTLGNARVTEAYGETEDSFINSDWRSCTSIIRICEITTSSETVWLYQGYRSTSSSSARFRAEIKAVRII